MFPTELALCKIEDWDHITAHVKYGGRLRQHSFLERHSLLRGQKKIVFRNCGLINLTTSKSTSLSAAISRFTMCSLKPAEW